MLIIFLTAGEIGNKLASATVLPKSILHSQSLKLSQHKMTHQSETITEQCNDIRLMKFKVLLTREGGGLW